MVESVRLLCSNPLSFSNSYVPPPKELGDILFLVWILSASAA